MRQLYADRRRALAVALEQRLGNRVRVELQAGGIHLMAWLPSGTDDKALERQAGEQGLAPFALSHAATLAKPPPALALSFTNIPVEDAPRLVGRLAVAFDAAGL
jgi:GntR family transcriptional regulator/MocR family aminotransferase